MCLTIPASREERIRIFVARLKAREPFASFDQAWAELEKELDAVEDAFSGIAKSPYNPDGDPYDGRLYPPHPKWERASGSPGVRTFRQKGHQTSYADNGAIEIVPIDDHNNPILDTPILNKPGSDGRCLGDYRTRK